MAKNTQAPTCACSLSAQLWYCCRKRGEVSHSGEPLVVHVEPRHNAGPGAATAVNDGTGGMGRRETLRYPPRHQQTNRVSPYQRGQSHVKVSKIFRRSTVETIASDRPRNAL